MNITANLTESNNDGDDIKTLERIRWRSAISARIERFSAAIEDREIFEKYFGEKYVEQLSQKTGNLVRMILLLGAVYTMLMLSLFVSQDSNKTEFEVFGYGFKNLGYHKEFLLLLAAGITPISAILSAYHKYVVAIRDECLKQLAPDPAVRAFYSQIHLSSYFDAIVKADTDETSRSHVLARSLMTVFILVLVLLFLTLIAGSFLVQINVIYDVATNPASSKYVNIFVVTFSVASIGLSWLIGLLQLPLPEIDLRIHHRLALLGKRDPAKYHEVMKRIARESAKREDFWTTVLSLVIYVISYSTIAVIWYPDALDQLSDFIASAMPGAFITMLLGRSAAMKIRPTLLRWYFRNYSVENENGRKMFLLVRKVLMLARITTPLVFSVGYAIYAMSGL